MYRRSHLTVLITWKCGLDFDLGQMGQSVTQGVWSQFWALLAVEGLHPDPSSTETILLGRWLQLGGGGRRRCILLHYKYVTAEIKISKEIYCF